MDTNQARGSAARPCIFMLVVRRSESFFRMLVRFRKGSIAIVTAQSTHGIHSVGYGRQPALWNQEFLPLFNGFSQGATRVVIVVSFQTFPDLRLWHLGQM